MAKLWFSFRVLALTIGVTTFATGAVAQVQRAGSASVTPLHLKGMDYGRARKNILDDGWRPVAGPCLQVDTDTCAHFPEIESCAGVEPDYCAMAFIKENRCLYVTTLGDPPNGRNAGAATIKKATLRPGPCAKH